MHRGISTVWFNPPISQGVFSGNLGSQLPERFLGNWEVGKSNLAFCWNIAPTESAQIANPLKSQASKIYLTSSNANNDVAKLAMPIDEGYTTTNLKFGQKFPQRSPSQNFS